MNGYSIIHNYENKELYTPDFDFIQAALNYKQQSYDVNKAKIQSAYDQISLLKVSKSVDQEYIDARLKEVANISNRYLSMDVSDNNFASSITNNINQVLDEKVQNAVISTKSMQAEDKYIESLKGTDKYSEKSHQYALAKSDRQRYLNSTEAGDRYRAGLDYREYRDVRGKLMKTMPELAKMFYDQSKEMGQGSGAGGFTTWNTYQGVEKDKVRNAILSQLDDKDRAYLEVEAWSEYDQLPDDYIREEYNGKISEQLSDVKRQVQGFETAIAGLKDSDPRKTQYQEWLNTGKEKQLALEEGDYDNVLSKYGTGARSRLYNALYQDKFVDGFAETFKEDRKLVDIELDKANEANINYNLKVAQETQDQANWEKDYALKVLKEQNALAKTTGSNNAGQKGTGDGDGEYANVLQIKTKGEDAEAPLVRILDAEKEATNGFREIFGMRPGVGNLPKLKKEFANLAEKRANGGTINFNGKEVNVKKLNLEQYKKLVDFNNLVVEDHPIKGQYEDIAYGGLQKQIETLTTIVDANSGQSTQGREGSSFNIYDLPRMTGKFNKDMKWVPIEDPSNDHHYVRLLKKNAKGQLDAHEKATLEAYATKHLLADNLLSKEEKQLVYNSVKKNLITTNGGIAATEVVKGLEGRKGALQKEESLGASLWNAATAVIGQGPKAGTAIQSEKDILGKKPFQDYYLSEIDYADRDYVKDGVDKRTKGFDDIWKETRTAMISTDQMYNTLTKQEAEYYAPVITPGSGKYTQAVSALSTNEQLEGFKIDVKQAISASPVDEDGVYSDTEVRVRVKNTQGAMKTVVLSAPEASKLGFNFVKPERTTYDAKFGQYASKLPLGTGNLSKGVYEEDVVLENYKDYMSTGLMTDGLVNVVKAYQAGTIDVVLEPNKDTEVYEAVLYNRGQVVGKVPTTSQKFLFSDVDNMSKNAGSAASAYVDQFIRGELYRLEKTSEISNSLNLINQQ